MMVYSIEAALQSGIFDAVYVSSEDGSIGDVATSAGARYHHRPDHLAGDLVSATDVCLEVAEVLAGRGDRYDAIVCLQPSSPLRSSEDIRGSWQRFVETGADYLVSVTEVDPHYFHWAVHQTDDRWDMYFGKTYLKERLELPTVYRPNGAIKIGRISSLAATKNFFGQKLDVYNMPEERSVHVATLFDFRLAEHLLCERT